MLSGDDEGLKVVNVAFFTESARNVLLRPLEGAFVYIQRE
jgi:hypothetical protein